jgi:hypothetical protein
MNHLKEGAQHATAAPEHGTAEEFQPLYVFTPRMAGRLALGELATEPVLGPVRVTGLDQAEEEDHPDGSFVFVSWRDEHGPGHATGRYPSSRSFEVRMPAPEDRRLVRQGIDRAQWHRREINGDTARLIAAHLHPGTGSALHRFTADGSISERVYDELEQAALHRHYARHWVHALTRYCLAREDPGPAWTTQATAETEARAEELLTAAGVTLNRPAHPVPGGNGERRTRHAGLLARKQMPTETVARLIDAAFLLGVTAARKRALPAAVRQRLSTP